VPRQRFRIGAIARALIEHSLDVVLGDERGNSVTQRLGHRDGFDDPLTWLRQPFPLGRIRGGGCDGVGWVAAGLV
jgi:hypothetical protein